MINNLTISGNVGRDVEVRYLPNGTAVADIAVASTSGWGDKKKTTWVSCTLWKERAEKLAPFLSKGTSVVVSGEFHLSDPFTNKKGETSQTVKMNVNQLQFSGPTSIPKETVRGSQPKPVADVKMTDADYAEWDDDVPFKGV